ncbi:TIGR04149 family rSAM-modified RiPP [Flavobacterium sp.]|jgi:natural product precursor|uniref:TIGR04149 family rSAM-modified RiPP n=1 Tax=Flavobacterium sp. TaxID=239 RepID=UPI0037C192E7
MKLENLKLDKFQDKALKKEQMFKLNGGNTVTAGGFGCGAGTVSSDMSTIYSYNFGYDINRGNGHITYHDRTNLKKITSAECNGMQNA